MNTMNRRSFLARGTAAAVPLAGASRAWGAAAKTESGGQVVATNAGKIRGAMQGKVNAFKGIPNGASTGGAERFMPPSKPQPWTGVRDALELGPALRQIPSNLTPGSMALQPKGGGAGYSAGSANWAMKHYAVVVTVNHLRRFSGIYIWPI